MSDELGESVPAPASDTGGSAPSQSASVSDSQLSDDQVLDRALARDETSAEVPAKAEGDQPEAVAQPEAESEGQPETEPGDEPSVLHSEPEELRRVFKAHPEMRRAWFAEKAYREVFPTLAEARQIKEAFPTVEDAGRIVQQADTLLAVEQAYLDTPDRFLAALGRGNPEAFKKLAESIPGQLHEMDPALYRTAVAEPVTQSLLMNLARRAQRDGDEELATAVQLLGSRLFGGRAAKAATQAKDDPRYAELEQFKAAEGQRQQEAVQHFDSTLKRTVVERLDSGVNEAIARLAPALPAKAMASAKDEILSGVIGKLVSNQWLSKQAQSLQRSGSFDANHLNQIAGLLLTHAQPLIGATVKQVLAEWTSGLVQANAERRTQASKAAERKDIGAGSGNGADAKSRKVVADADFYKKYSDDDIVHKRHLQQ